MITAADLGLRVGISDPTDDELLQLARTLGAVRAKIGATHTLPTGFSDDDQDAWDEAHLLAASRLWKRHDTPEGIVGLGSDSVIRVGRFDADVEDMLAAYVVWSIG